ncbi:hypothetical protein J3R30DRAFT_3418264 [Lentinula aciculospora]|uniref:Uncharacterized protein n=1 Tax=Lentinula aciculospora TaxID=153920 RepID=A0A9W9DXQ0_9AGAR|nr:hypothetical protein J3R30DRAFT_3418264 [Lentinula aciculospora]
MVASIVSAIICPCLFNSLHGVDNGNVLHPTVSRTQFLIPTTREDVQVAMSILLLISGRTRTLSLPLLPVLNNMLSNINRSSHSRGRIYGELENRMSIFRERQNALVY